MGVAQPIELGALDFELAAAQAVFLDDAGVGVDDDDAARSVDDDEFVGLKQIAHMVQADDSRNLQAAGDDRGVAGGATDVGDEAGDVVIAKADGVGRRGAQQSRHGRFVIGHADGELRPGGRFQGRHQRLGTDRHKAEAKA